MKSAQAINGRTRSALKAQIDENLRRVYKEALTEEVPDKFKELLDRLKAAEDDK